MSPRKVDPCSVTAGEAARLLGAAGREVTVEMIEEAIAAGAPTLPDGRLNLVELAAWLEREVAGSR